MYEGKGSRDGPHLRPPALVAPRKTLRESGVREGRSPLSPVHALDSPPPPSRFFRGERKVLEADPSALVIRTNVVFGPESVGKNFVYQLVRKLRAGERMNVPEDQVRFALGNHSAT